MVLWLAGVFAFLQPTPG